MFYEFGGYHVGDITYCVVPDSTTCFPVVVAAVGKNFLDVQPLEHTISESVSPGFATDKTNRRFHHPHLPKMARFGGCDERLVNSKRKSGVELRLLPTHYGTTTGAKIRELHGSDPERWPLPTGLVFERWFQGSASPPAGT